MTKDLFVKCAFASVIGAFCGATFGLVMGLLVYFAIVPTILLVSEMFGD